MDEKTLSDLQELKTEIENTLAADRSMALEINYWSNVLKKIEERMAKQRIEEIYTRYCEENLDKIKAEIKIAEARKKESSSGASKEYQTPFTALKIDNIKKGMVAPSQQEEARGNCQEDQQVIEEIKYNDGTLSPVRIPYGEAGYLLALAVTDEEINQEQEQIKKEYLMKQLKKV